ncbi:IclR family transcriptional regulator [Paenibacillus silvisoli]|uniref:IclR family transcriptional regulator n=1 Tax=Paenibacillus silvisoli TaxID=3110539 RepID=UPI00280600E8|nr:IclR family transcriptional regulator [Paenibacillus silvisoli]
MKKYSVPALEKAIAILDLLATSEDELTITEIHVQLNLPKASVFMILNALESYNVVTKNPSGRYSIGVKLYNLGMSYMTKMDLKKIARPHLEQLCKETGFTSHLGIMVDGKVMFVVKVEQKTSFIKFSTFEGMTSDIHISSLGKAMAAYLPEDQLDTYLQQHGMGRYTPNTIVSPDVFKKILPSVRATGYSIEDEEGEIGVRCIGSPIFDHEGNVIAAASITALRSDLLLDVIPVTGEKVKRAAEAISKQLGYEQNQTNRQYS